MRFEDQREAAVCLGRQLETLGWTLFGMYEDKSESQSDYFAPAHWDGVATMGEVVVVVASGHNLRSGKDEERTVLDQGETCCRCQGAKTDPLGWTLSEAREKPFLFNSDMLRAEHHGAVERGGELPRTKGDHGVAIEANGLRFSNLMAAVVSPLLFRDDGSLTCRRCHGRGHDVVPRKEYLFTWPTYSPNPKGKTWHLERAGTIFASGVGLNRLSIYHDRGQVEAKKLAVRIDALATGGATVERPASPPDGAAAVTLNSALQGIEIRFPAKPDPATLSDLKAHGWRWSRSGGCWYRRDSGTSRAYAASFGPLPLSSQQ